MTNVFDGKAFAERKKKLIKERVASLLKRGIKPTLVSIYLASDYGSILYTRIKKRVSEEVGIKFIPLKVNNFNHIEPIIEKYNSDTSIQGILIQKPSGDMVRKKEWERIVNVIHRSKDIDGLREDSLYLHATAKAVIEILNQSPIFKDRNRKLKIVVVGAQGMVGKSLVKAFKDLNYKVKGIDLETQDLGSKTKKADVLISATGVPGLIRGKMVKEKAVVIDVGFPKGDIQFNEVVKKASFITPVPGGVGPVTVICLLDNLVQTLYSKE